MVSLKVAARTTGYNTRGGIAVIQTSPFNDLVVCDKKLLLT